MLFRRDLVLEQRKDDILRQCRRGVENSTVVGGDKQHDHQQTEQPDQTDGMR